MEAVVFVEVLDKRERVLQRTRVNRLPVTIGRSYANDVILDDPFVAPEHARIERDADGQLVLDDLGNAPPSGRRAVVTGDRPIRLGRTMVRIREAQYPVPAALPQRPSVRSGHVFQRPLACVAAFVLAVWVLALDAYLGSYERITPGPILTRMAIVITLLVLWAGAWSLASRVLTQRFRMLQHCAVAALAMLACFLYAHGLDYYAFAFGAERSVQVLTWAGAFGLPVGILYAHSRLVSSASGRRLALGALAASATFVGLAALFVGGVYASPSLYFWTSQPRFPGQLKLPSLRVAHSRQVEEFFSASQELKARVDAAGRE